MGVEALLGRFSPDFVSTVFMNGHGNCSYVVREAENTLNNHNKKGYLRFGSLE
jgi:hypothetical protein